MLQQCQRGKRNFLSRRFHSSQKVNIQLGGKGIPRRSPPSVSTLVRKGPGWTLRMDRNGNGERHDNLAGEHRPPMAVRNDRHGARGLFRQRLDERSIQRLASSRMRTGCDRPSAAWPGPFASHSSGPMEKRSAPRRDDKEILPRFRLLGTGKLPVIRAARQIVEHRFSNGLVGWLGWQWHSPRCRGGGLAPGTWAPLVWHARLVAASAVA